MLAQLSSLSQGPSYEQHDAEATRSAAIAVISLLATTVKDIDASVKGLSFNGDSLEVLAFLCRLQRDTLYEIASRKTFWDVPDLAKTLVAYIKGFETWLNSLSRHLQSSITSQGHSQQSSQFMSNAIRDIASSSILIAAPATPQTVLETIGIMTVNDVSLPSNETPQAIMHSNVMTGINPLMEVPAAMVIIDPSELQAPSENLSGSHAVILRGTYRNQLVAIKELQSERTQSSEKILERIGRERRIWDQLNHKNIVPFIGLSGLQGQNPKLVSQWMPKGNAPEYVTQQFSRYREDGSRRPDFLDIADGMIYLHSQGVIHRVLKGSNVLIDGDGTARISDFALSVIEGEAQTNSRMSAPNWTAPEVLNGGGHTKESDMYSFGCTMYEIISGREPFDNYGQRAKLTLQKKIKNGEQPVFPTRNDQASELGLIDETCRLWQLLRESWCMEPRGRPSAAMMKTKLETIWREWESAP
ncbi:kinase-like protein [Clavulina sp. PMI_390]|nr:kinase-like protein [Clavulina sp. PMI_390]